MSSNALLSNFTVQVYLGILFFSFACSVLYSLVSIVSSMNK